MSETDFPVAFGPSGVMRGRIDRTNAIVTLALTGEFDIASRDAFNVTMAEIESTSPRAIVVNVQDLTFIDSTGVRVLLEANRRAVGKDRSFAVLNGSGPAHTTLQLVGLGEIVTMIDHPSELAAPPR
ncbi:MAG: STAS domain-containing protein [Actinobacteria bacterium]|nr:STAS domain-containing protein [Actinomycetota bacterium]